MYLRKLILENAGPIEYLEFASEFSDEGFPKPIVLVGENGSGKSIFLSYVVNGLLAAQQAIFSENTDVELGKVYKLRSADYIRSGNHFTFGKVEFEDDLSATEWQLLKSKKMFEEEFGYSSIRKEWNDIPEHERSHYDSTFHHNAEAVTKHFESNVILYFPHNRFEDPAWLNIYNLNAQAEFAEKRNITGYSTRRIVNPSPLAANKNWLLEVLFDRSITDLSVIPMNLPVKAQTGSAHQISVNLFGGYVGQSARFYDAALKILRAIVPKGDSLRFGIAQRRNRKVALMLGEEQIVNNIFQMSSGETSLLNLFLSILRDFDATGKEFNGTEDVRGIVLVDEVDLHLHTIHQRKILPELLSLFPKVQFIVTTHSPLFVLGLEDVLGKDKYTLLQMPDASRIGPEQFSEFDEAYESFRNSHRHTREILSEIEKSRKPLLFVEGDYDIKYIEKASAVLGDEHIISKIEIKDGEGFGGLKKIKNGFDSKLSEIVPQKILLLFDCDIDRNYAPRGNVTSKTIPLQNQNPVQKGIENLFSQETLRKAIAAKAAFVDITAEHIKKERGVEVVVPEKWEINESEKKNLCDWLVANGLAEDFADFERVFAIIEETLIT